MVPADVAPPSATTQLKQRGSEGWNKRKSLTRLHTDAKPAHLMPPNALT
jgi:hypothetical protein